MSPPTPPLPPPPPPAPRDWTRNARWQRWVDDFVRVFHAYANWLVGITWTRFILLSLLLLILASVLADLAASNGGEREEVTIAPSVPIPPKPGAPRAEPGAPPPGVTIRKKDADGRQVTISIDQNGVRINPSPAQEATSAPAGAASHAAPASPAPAASSASSAASAASATNANGDGVEIRLPRGADSAQVRAAVEEARAAVVEAIRERAREAAEQARDAAQEAREEAEANRKAVRTIRRIRNEGSKPPLEGLAWLFIVASTILKISYKGRIQAEVKAAAATETAESEQLKRQVVEARMAAMQAQVEPHFLFNTLASIDHLIETDPPRASQMQKNLIALLRASMPSMRDATPAAHNLGREMAVIRPYLEILKVRMEDRLQTGIDVPDGLLSAEFPSMMIQSLVENAIKHGLEPKAEGGRLDVKAEIVHGNLAVTVADTGLGFGRAATAGTGVGMANIRERLKLLYGDRASMTVADNSPSGTVVTLTVPYQAQMRQGASA
ncbi:MAG TPA: histidine kinase [Caldimonas sp.]|nr:histidine kinase [Caldimonas sp.]